MKEVIVLIPFCLSQKVCNEFKKKGILHLQNPPTGIRCKIHKT